MPHRSRCLAFVALCVGVAVIVVWAAWTALDRAAPSALDNNANQPFAVVSVNTVGIQSLAISADAAYLAIGGSLPEEIKIWSIASKAWTVSIPATALDRAPAYLMKRPCRGVVANGGAMTATIHECDRKILRTLNLVPLVLRPAPDEPVHVVEKVVGVCDFAIIQFQFGVSVVDLKELKIRRDLSDLFPSGVSAVAAPANNLDCIAYAVRLGDRDPSTHDAGAQKEPTIVYAIDLKAAGRVEFARLSATESLPAPILIHDFAVSPNNGRAVVLTIRGSAHFIEHIDIRSKTVDARPRPRGFDIPAWIDDDRFIFQAESRDLIVMNAVTGAQTPLSLAIPTGDLAWHVAFAPQRNVLAIASNKIVLLFSIRHTKRTK